VALFCAPVNLQLRALAAVRCDQNSNSGLFPTERRRSGYPTDGTLFNRVSVMGSRTAAGRQKYHQVDGQDRAKTRHRQFHSITSSAVASNTGRTEMPSAWAVSLLQEAGRNRHASALNAKHHCEEFLSKRERIG
jgi:hypothetical protein